MVDSPAILLVFLALGLEGVPSLAWAQHCHASPDVLVPTGSVDPVYYEEIPGARKMSATLFLKPESPSRAREGQRNTNLTNTGGKLVDGAEKHEEGETRAAEERPVLGESREFSTVCVLARLEVDSIRCSLGI
ncbi:hypothetical protein E2C01_079351 [Portunus trituberculatus]|uniref:Uncharacterized protein n=1 Tax=Portunus trituberculatus TaxID=210409 RepID=A0A5B7IT48_PORTR|nr:hypothetical protein [Portunus trituberculatus]